jgi:hypothetical protein
MYKDLSKKQLIQVDNLVGKLKDTKKLLSWKLRVLILKTN